MSARAPRTNSVFEMGWELVLVLVTMALIMFALTRTARAADTDTPPRPKRSMIKQHTTTVIDRDQDVDPDDEITGSNATVPSAEAQREKVMTAKFGSKSTSGMAGCKTVELSTDTIRELKSDCNAWLKDRRTELKGKYLTGMCEENCEDCGMNLQRCNVNGSVHYTTATVK